jgi:3-hydroxyacyl-[acyl-carrier-protein] dehydratase
MTPVARWQSVPLSHPAIAGHFPAFPVVPGAWLLTLVEDECLRQSGGRWRLAGIRQVRFRQVVSPDTRFCIRLEPLASGELSFAIDGEGGRLADGKLALDDLP